MKILKKHKSYGRTGSEMSGGVSCGRSLIYVAKKPVPINLFAGAFVGSSGPSAAAALSFDVGGGRGGGGGNGAGVRVVRSDCCRFGRDDNTEDEEDT